MNYKQGRLDISQDTCTFKTYHKFHVPITQNVYKHYIIFSLLIYLLLVLLRLYYTVTFLS